MHNLNNYRNIVVSKYYQMGEISAHTLRLGLFLCPGFTICGCLPRALVVMASASPFDVLRQREVGSRFFMPASLKIK